MICARLSRDRSLGLLVDFNVRLLRQGVRGVVRTRGSTAFRGVLNIDRREAGVGKSESPKDAKDAAERQTSAPVKAGMRNSEGRRAGTTRDL